MSRNSTSTGVALRSASAATGSVDDPAIATRPVAFSNRVSRSTANRSSSTMYARMYRLSAQRHAARAAGTAKARKHEDVAKKIFFEKRSSSCVLRDLRVFVVKVETHEGIVIITRV